MIKKSSFYIGIYLPVTRKYQFEPEFELKSEYLLHSSLQIGHKGKFFGLYLGRHTLPHKATTVIPGKTTESNFFET